MKKERERERVGKENEREAAPLLIRTKGTLGYSEH